MSFQYEARLTAVADLVSHVVPRTMDDPVRNQAGGSTGVTGQHWNTERKKVGTVLLQRAATRGGTRLV